MENLIKDGLDPSSPDNKSGNESDNDESNDQFVEN